MRAIASFALVFSLLLGSVDSRSDEINFDQDPVVTIDLNSKPKAETRYMYPILGYGALGLVIFFGARHIWNYRAKLN